MKKELQKMISKAGLSLALGAASKSVVQGCYWTQHQPKEPKALANMMQKSK